MRWAAAATARLRFVLLYGRRFDPHIAAAAGARRDHRSQRSRPRLNPAGRRGDSRSDTDNSPGSGVRQRACRAPRHVGAGAHAAADQDRHAFCLSEEEGARSHLQRARCRLVEPQPAWHFPGRRSDPHLSQWFGRCLGGRIRRGRRRGPGRAGANARCPAGRG